MIETHFSKRINEAQRIAHQERAEAFAAMFGTLPRVIANLTYQARNAILGQKLYKLGTH